MTEWILAIVGIINATTGIGMLILEIVRTVKERRRRGEIEKAGNNRP